MNEKMIDPMVEKEIKKYGFDTQELLRKFIENLMEKFVFVNKKEVQK